MKKKILIEGMHCASCAMNIERSLKKVDGVKEVGVSVLTKKVIVETDEKVTDDELKKAVSKVGYKVVSIE